MAIIERDHYPDNALNKLDTALNDIEKLKRTASTAGITTSDVSALIAAHAADADAHHAYPSSATEAAEGVIELATTAEAQAGTDTERAVTPAGLRADVPATPAASRGVRLDASGHLMLPASGDIYPDNDGRGLMTRMVNGGIAYDTHFRGPDSIPSGYAWQGSPFGALSGTIYYSWLDEMLNMLPPASTRSFMSRAVTNAAANFQNKYLYGRFCCGANDRVGLRIDDGTDDNYAQIVVDGTANDGTETLKFQHRTGAGAVTTVSSSVLLPAFTFVIFRLRSTYNAIGGTYIAYGDLYSPEVAGGVTITNFNVAITGWVPVAGRAGIFVENPTGSTANRCYCDWFYNEFV